jgi:hypothetical protein
MTTFLRVERINEQHGSHDKFRLLDITDLETRSYEEKEYDKKNQVRYFELKETKRR